MYEKYTITLFQEYAKYKIKIASDEMYKVLLRIYFAASIAKINNKYHSLFSYTSYGFDFHIIDHWLFMIVQNTNVKKVFQWVQVLLCVFTLLELNTL